MNNIKHDRSAHTQIHHVAHSSYSLSHHSLSLFSLLAILTSIFGLPTQLLLGEPLATTESSNETTLPEIIIHGGVRDTPRSELPADSVVLDNKTLMKFGREHLDDTISQIPSLTVAGGSNRGRFFQIRGIGEVEQYEGAPNPSIGVLIDDIDLSGIGGVGTLFDIDTVEILKGPQVTRYGSNALGGLISIRSTEPSPISSGTAQISLGNDERTEGGIAFGGVAPGLSEDIQFRISAHQLHQNGFRNNTYLSRDDTNQRNEFTSRTKIRWTPSASFQADLSGMFIDYDNGYDAFSITNGYSTQSDRPGKDLQRSAGSALKLTFREADLFELISLSSYSRAHQAISYDGDWGNDTLWTPYLPYDYFSLSIRERKTLSQDLRLLSHDFQYKLGESWRWSVGAYTSRLSEDTTTREDAEAVPYDLFSGGYTARTGALYGAIEAPLTHRTSATFSLRNERRLMAFDDTRGSSAAPGDTMLGGGVALLHELDTTQQIYANVSRGFKGGGFNVNPNVPEGRKIYSPEYLWQIETGHRGQYLDGTLATDSTLFALFRRAAQSQVSFQNDPSDPLSFTYITDNTSKALSTGVEEDITLQIGDSLRLHTTGALLFSEYTSVDPSSQDILDGRAPAYAPRWKYFSEGTYTIYEPLSVSLGISGTSSFYFSDSHSMRSSPTHQVHASVRYAFQRLSLSLWTRNLFNERNEIHGFFFGNEPPDFPEKLYVQRGDPRTFGITATYAF